MRPSLKLVYTITSIFHFYYFSRIASHNNIARNIFRNYCPCTYSYIISDCNRTKNSSSSTYITIITDKYQWRLQSWLFFYLIRPAEELCNFFLLRKNYLPKCTRNELCATLFQNTQVTRISYTCAEDT